MIIGKYECNSGETHFADSDTDEIIDIMAQLEDMTGDTVGFNNVEFFSARPLKVKRDITYNIS